MPNLSGGGQNLNLFDPWDRQASLRVPAAIPASSLTFYTSQAVMRDGNGNIIQCDDTVKGEFVGFIQRIFNQTAQSTDQIQQNAVMGDTLLEEIIQPQRFMCQFASVAPGQEGQKVYWLYNNQVQQTPTNNCNFAGTIWQYFDSTHAWVLPPWLNKGLGQGGIYNSVNYLPNAVYTSGTSFTATKWDTNRAWWITPTGAFTFTLPLASLCSPGDQISISNLSAGLYGITVSGNGSTINGASTYSIAATQYTHASFQTDGSNWVAV